MPQFGLNPKVERALILFGGICVWVLTVRMVLRAMKFPFHRHQTIVTCIIVLPIVVFALVIFGMECFFTVDKKDDD